MLLIDVLKRCLALTEVSQDAAFSPTRTVEIVAILNRGIESLGHDKELDRSELKLLFAPTGALQETSIDNGWADEYLLLAARFDGLIEQSPNNSLQQTAKSFFGFLFSG